MGSRFFVGEGSQQQLLSTSLGLDPPSLYPEEAGDQRKATTMRTATATHLLHRFLLLETPAESSAWHFPIRSRDTEMPHIR